MQYGINEKLEIWSDYMHEFYPELLKFLLQTEECIAPLCTCLIKYKILEKCLGLAVSNYINP